MVWDDEVDVWKVTAGKSVGEVMVTGDDGVDERMVTGDTGLGVMMVTGEGEAVQIVLTLFSGQIVLIKNSEEGGGRTCERDN